MMTSGVVQYPLSGSQAELGNQIVLQPNPGVEK